MLRNFISRHRLTLRYMMVAMVLLMVAGNAFAQSVELEIDTDAFINSINVWLALAVGIIVIGVGIKGAFALARMVGDMIVEAFSSKR